MHTSRIMCLLVGQKIADAEDLKSLEDGEKLWHNGTRMKG